MRSMMRAPLAACLMLATLMAGPAGALQLEPAQPPPPPPQAKPRQPAPPQPPVPPEAPPPPRTPDGQLVNVRIDITITDQRGSSQPVVKTVSMTVADRENGMIRSEGQIQRFAEGGHLQEVPLAVDARPIITEGNKLRLRMTLSYDLVDQAVEKGPLPRTTIRESLGLILENGKPLVVAQSADPISDRKVMVEVRATILR